MKSDNVQYRDGDLTESTETIAFPWNRFHEIENGLQKDLERLFKIKDLATSGACIVESSVIKRDGKYIYGLISKLNSEEEITPGILKESLEHMKRHALQEKIKKIEFPEIKLRGEIDLKDLLEEVFGGTAINCCIVTRKKGVNSVQEKEDKIEEKDEIPGNLKPFSKILGKEYFSELLEKNQEKKSVNFSKNQEIKKEIKELLLEALEQSGAQTQEDIQSVMDTPGEVFND
jgi:hypothetical protein